MFTKGKERLAVKGSRGDSGSVSMTRWGVKKIFSGQNLKIRFECHKLQINSEEATTSDKNG